MSRTRRAAWNYATTLLFTATTLLVGLASTPYIVRHLGDARYGAFRVLNDAYGYLTLLEMGLGAALGPMLARAAGRGDERALRGALAAGLRAYAVVAVAGVLLGLAATPLLLRAVGARGPLAADVRLAWLVFLAGFTALALSPFRALLEARQRGYWANLLVTAQALATTGAAVALAGLGWGIAGQAAALVLGGVLLSLALARAALAHHPGLFGAALRSAPDPEAWRDLRRLSGPTMVVSLCGRLGLMTDYLVITALIDPAAVTPVYLVQRLAVLVQMQLLGVGSAVWAGLAELHARGEHAAFARRLVELTRLIAVLGAAALAPVVAYNHHFVLRWAGRDVPGGAAIVAAAAVNALLQGLVALWGWCFSGTGRIGRTVGAYLLATALNLAGSIAFTLWLGPVGPLLGTTLGTAGVLLWALPLLLRSTFGVPLRSLVAAAAAPVAWGLAYLAPLWWLARTHVPRGYVGLALEMGPAALGFLALAWFAILGPEERALWRARFGRRRAAPAAAAGAAVP